MASPDAPAAPPPLPDDLVKVRDLHRRFENVNAVQGIS